jgi:signal transduction histidine kinase
MTDENRTDSRRAVAPSGADLRHDFLTPINHIIGYGELLQEETEELEQSELSAGVRDIVGLGRDVLALINRILPTVGGPRDPAELADLRSSLSALLDRIVANCERLRESAEVSGREMLLKDLQQVRAAADRLAELVERGIGSPGTAAGHPGH